MKIVNLSEQEAARTGYSHVAHFKVTAGDLDTTGEAMDVIALPIGSTVDKVAFFIKTIWDKTVTIAVGIAATATSATTFINGATIGTGGTSGTIVTTAATFPTVNNTASRFLTATVTVTSGPATAGEGYLYFNLVSHADIYQPLF